MNASPVSFSAVVSVVFYSTPVVLVLSTIFFEFIFYRNLESLDFFAYIVDRGLFDYWPKLKVDYDFLIYISRENFAEKYSVYFLYISLVFIFMSVISFFVFLAVSILNVTPKKHLNSVEFILFSGFFASVISFFTFVCRLYFRDVGGFGSQGVPVGEGSFIYIIISLTLISMCLNALYLSLFRRLLWCIRSYFYLY